MSGDARKLLAEVVDSFEKLEIVIHVARAGFVRQPAAEIAKAIGMRLEDVQPCIVELDDERVLDPNGPWSNAVAELVTLYDEDRLEVMNLLTNRALARVRKAAARVFADAFVLRPKKKGDPDA